MELLYGAMFGKKSCAIWEAHTCVHVKWLSPEKRICQKKYIYANKISVVEFFFVWAVWAINKIITKADNWLKSGYYSIENET